MRLESFTKYSPANPTEIFEGDKRVNLSITWLKVASRRMRSDITPMIIQLDNGENHHRSLLAFISEKGSQSSIVRMMASIITDEFKVGFDGQ